MLSPDLYSPLDTSMAYGRSLLKYQKTTPDHTAVRAAVYLFIADTSRSFVHIICDHATTNKKEHYGAALLVISSSADPADQIIEEPNNNSRPDGNEDCFFVWHKQGA